MKGIGLVLAGGGGKGSYEIGVWKYLHEIGLDQYIKAVSGTSVGALNAALFVGANFETAENIWLNIEQSDILMLKKITMDDVVKWLLKVGLPGMIFMGNINSMMRYAYASVLQIAPLFYKRLLFDYPFTREGLERIIKDELDFAKLKSSNIPCFATCLKCPKFEVERFKLNDYEARDVTKVLLASSALPIVFPEENFNGNTYRDGGLPLVGDNIPISPLYDLGLEYIFVVHLSQDSIINKADYPKSKIIEIVPSIDLGDLLKGTLDFSKNGSEKRIKLGYKDAKKVLQPMLDMLYLSAENQMILKTAQKKNDVFERKRKKLLSEEQRIIDEMDKDGFDEMYNELLGGK